MKKTVVFSLLGAEAALCALLSWLRFSGTALFSAAMAFPFEPIGYWLRALSLSGDIGNAAAISIYLILGLLPFFAFLILRRKKMSCAADGLLPLLSASLLFVLYLMINPGEIARLFGDSALIPIGRGLLGGALHALFCAYLVLRLLRLFESSEIDKLQKYMAALLCLCAMSLVYIIFGDRFGALLDAFSALGASNSGGAGALWLSYTFLTLRYLTDALPYALDIWVIFASLSLLLALKADRYSQSAQAAASLLGHRCKTALCVSVLCSAAFNILQFPFLLTLRTFHTTLELPIFSLLFVLFALLFARTIAENRALKDDNDRFI